MFEQKRALRAELRRRRLALSAAFSRRVAARVAVSAGRWLAPGRRVAVYIAAGSELDLAPLAVRALARRCQVFVPVVPRRGRRMGFVELRPDQRWVRNRHGIAEPLGRTVPAARLHHIFLPLVGFDSACHRLGQGGGYYDATLAPLLRPARRARPWLIGCAYACQEIDAVPREPWDAALDAVVTERRIHYRTAGNGAGSPPAL